MKSTDEDSKPCQPKHNGGLLRVLRNGLLTKKKFTQDLYPVKMFLMKEKYFQTNKYWKNSLLMFTLTEMIDRCFRQKQTWNQTETGLCKETKRTRSGINESKLQSFSYFLMI